MRRALAPVLALVLAVGLTSCGDEGDDDAGAPTTTTEAATDAGGDDGTTAPSDDSEPTDTGSTTGSSAPDDDEPLAGEPIDIYPYEGAELAVVGVEADDTLNVRARPGTTGQVLFELDPLATGIVATGNNRLLDSGLWAEVTADGRTGWANATYLLQPGRVDDITSTLFPSPADRPSADTMVELGEAVAALRASDEPPSRVVVVDGPSVGDLGEITVDVIGLADDAVGGERLVIFAEPDAGGGGFTVRSVEATTLCLRGVADESCL